MKHNMRTLILLLILGFLSEARKPRSERRPSATTPGREKRSPFGYVVRGPNHVAAFQMGSLEDGLLGHFPRFSSNGIDRGGAFVANSLSNFFNNLVNPSPPRSLGKPRQQVQTQRPLGVPPLLLNQRGPILGKKDAPVFAQGNVIGPRFGKAPPPVHVLPPVNLAPSIRPPTPGTRQSTQYFVLGDSAPEVTNLYNHPALPTVNPLHPFSRTFHNYPTIVTLGHSNPGVLPTLNPSRAFPTLNPPFYTNDFATFAVSQIEPTRTFLQPTFAPLPPSPPLAPPLPPPSFPSVARVPDSRPVTTLPKGTFFWFRLNNENFTFSPNYNEFMKSYQNPLFFTRPMQNSFFRPFFSSGNRAFLYPSVNRVSTTDQLPAYVPNYFPAHFPLNIPFLKAEDEHPAEGHPGKHTTIYHGPADGPTPTATVSVTESTATSDAGTEPTPTSDETTPESSAETTPGLDEDVNSSPVTEPGEDPAISSEHGREIDESVVTTELSKDEPIESFTESPGHSDPDGGKEPAYRGFVPATEAPPRKPLVPEAEDENVQAKEPSATVIPFDTSTTPEKDIRSRPRSFDQNSNDRDSTDGETTTKNSNDDFDDDVSTVRRTGKSSRESNDYEQFFVDFMSNPNSIDGAGKTESGLSTTVKTGLGESPETTTAAATTTTETTTTVRFDEFDHFVDIFAAEKPAQEETTTSVASEAPTVTTVPTTTELVPETTTAPKTTTTTTIKPKFKLTTKFRPRLTSIKTTTPKPKVRPTIKFKSRSTTIRTRVRITEPTTAKPSTTTSETTTTTTEATTTTTEVPTTTTEATTTTTEATTTTTEATTTTTTEATSTTTEPATETSTESTTVTSTREQGNREEPTATNATDEATTPPSNAVATPEREEVPTTMAIGEIPVTTAEPTSTEPPAKTETAEITTVLSSEMSTATTEALRTTTQNSQSANPIDETTIGSEDETTTAIAQATEKVEDAAQTTSTEATTETASAPKESAATIDTQTTVSATTESSPTTPSGLDSSPTTTVPESDAAAKSSQGPEITVEVPTTAVPPEADDSLKDPDRRDNDSEKEQAADDEGAIASTTEFASPVTSEQPRTNNRKSKKLEDDDSAPSEPTSATPGDETSTIGTDNSTDEIAEATTSAKTHSEDPDGVAADETTTATDNTEPSAENSGNTMSVTVNSTDSEVSQPELEERLERVPETVLVSGRNYSDVQDNHPVVTNIETPEDSRKVRRAATWFVWLLDREKIAKNLVNDVSDFAASRNIIYVVTAALLISSMLSLMGLYCTLRSKK